MGALILAIAAAVLGRSFVDEPPKPTRTTTQEGEFTRFEDSRRKLSITYPSSWQLISSPDPDVVLVTATVDASMLMRTTSIGTPVGAESIGSAKKLTDKLVMAGKNVKNLRPPRRIDDLGGLPGWLYIYSFRDASGKRGAHAHYFLFRGETMITLVFQTVPSERFTTYAPLFDRLAGTFRATSPDEDSSGSGA